MPRNRLASEKSPYLLQHADNPVDWRPWGEEAFEQARRESKPIFLSVGYSTCHWCHVMAHESFEDQSTAEIMNREFINIKVDREERPDVDRVYMTFVQATSGGGGWPMSVWLTPDLKPFAGGTYFPPEDRHGHPAFKKVLQRIAEGWRESQGAITEQATKILQALAEATSRAGPHQSVTERVFEVAYQQLARSFDTTNGGFGNAPKFPRPSTLNFLTRFYARQRGSLAPTGGSATPAANALEMTLLTLRKMAAGGIHDHLGGGFHRYSVDGYWHVPHFEKMLYDQAQLATAYLDAFQITGDQQYREIVRDILEYVRRDLTAPEGGFYSAEDADSEPAAASDTRQEPDKQAISGSPAAPLHAKAEGAFYVWAKEEIDQVLGTSAEMFSLHYGVEEQGNAPPGSDPQGEFTGKNILIQRSTLRETAARFGVGEPEVERRIGEARAELLAVRNKRPRPHLDDKIISAWNGLMISAFARAARVLENSSYLEAAQRAAVFLREHLYDGAVLARNFRGGRGVPGFADDYAFVIQGLLDLYEASWEIDWLRFALELQEIMDRLFLDRERGGYFSVTGDDPTILLRLKEDNDGAEPAASSVAALNLGRLGALFARPNWEAQARRVFEAFAPQLTHFPTALPQMLVAFDFLQQGAQQVVLAGTPTDPALAALHHELQRYFLPRAVVIALLDEQTRAFFGSDNEALRAMTPLGDKPVAYVCENFACRAPVRDPAGLHDLLLGTVGQPSPPRL